MRLRDVDENGRSLNVTGGIPRTTGESGIVQSVTVDLWSTSIVLKAGHRIRVQVTSSCFPRWDRNLNSQVPNQAATTPRVAQQTVHLGGIGVSSITHSFIP